MRIFCILLIALSGAYLIAQTFAWVFYGKSFFPDSGTLFEDKTDKNLWQTVFPKNMLRLIIAVFAAGVIGLLADTAISEVWISLPIAAAGGIFVNFLISVLFSPIYYKMHKSGEPTEKELEGMSAMVRETVTKFGYGVISVKHGSRGYLFRAVTANGRRLPKGERVVILYAENGCCFVESEEHLCDVLFEENGDEDE